MSSLRKKSELKLSLEEAVERILEGMPRTLPAAAVAQVRENVRLQFDFPDQYVAYIDSWTGRGKSRQFERRILAHSRELKPVADAVAALPAKERARAFLDYVPDPAGPVSVRCHEAVE